MGTPSNYSVRLNYAEIPKLISDILFGQASTVFPERKIFIIATLVGLLSTFIGIVWNLIIGLTLILDFMLGLFFGVYFVLFYFARFKNKYRPLIFIITTLLVLTVLYITNGGLTGSVPAIYIFALATFISLTDAKFHKYILLVTLANLLGLILLENLFYENLIIQYSDTDIKELDLAFGYLASLTVSYFLLSYFKKNITLKNIELQKLNQSKDLLFNVVAHDLRSPFSTILGFSDLMVDESQNFTIEDFRKYSRLIQQETKKDYELLNTLLEWGRIHMDRIQLNPEAINLKETAHETVQFLTEKFQQKEIDIQLDINEDIYVYSDAVALKTILRNLISNAIKFTPGGGKINISTEESDEKNLTVKVKDNGIGMQKEIIDNLFQSEVNTNREGVGGEKSIGLGLIISRELIEKQGGNLVISSLEDQGSTFQFTIAKANIT